MRVLFYLTLLTLTCCYAGWRGGWPERLTALMFLLQAVLIIAADRLIGNSGFLQLVVPDFTVDTLVLLGLVAVAMTADRFWPILMVGLHGTVMAAHLARAADTSITSIAYGTMMAVWSYPMLALLVIATARHRQRLARQGFDLDWSRRSRRGSRGS